MMTPEHLRTLRRGLGLTQAKLAAALRVTPNTVARWEQGVHPIGPLATAALMHLALTHGGRRKSRKAS